MFRVLLVDDEAFFRQGLKELIAWEQCGFEVCGETDNGEDALEMILRDAPDLVITDIRMPVLDGLNLIQRAVQEHKLQTKFVIVSGYDEFKYAQQAVKYGVCDFLLKPIDEDAMEATLLELKGRLEREEEAAMRERHQLGSAIVAKLLKEEVSAAQAEQWHADLELPPRGDLHYMIVELNEPGPLLPAIPTDEQHDVRRLLLDAMAAIVPSMRPLHTYQHRRRLGVVVPAAALPEHWTMERLAKALQSKLQQAVDCPVCVYVGMAVSRLADLRLAYQSAKEAMLYKYGDEKRVVFMHGELSASPRHYMIMEQSYFHRLSECVEEQNEPAIIEAVDHIFAQFRARCYVPEAVRTSLHRYVSEAFAMLERMEIDTNAMTYKEPMLSWYDRNVTGAVLKQLFLGFVAECSRLAAQQRKDLAKGGVQKVKNYIDANYATNINLKSLAARYYMNPVYLGQLFKKTYGVYFNEYVLQLRIGEAKRLLRQTDLRIYEIADRIGFNNTEYFVSQFEKMERMTPTEYRNSLR